MATRVILPALSLAVFALFSFGCAKDESILAQLEEIHGGNIANVCDFPAVVRLGDRCTGFLVTSRMVVTAGHCGSDLYAAKVRAGSDATEEPLARCESPYPEPPYPDIAFCALQNITVAIPAVPIIPVCRLPELVPGLPVTVVGTGRTGPGQAPTGTLKFTTGTLIGYSDVSIEVRMQEGQTCSGDSGGPLYVALADGWYAIGVVSHGDAIQCDQEIMFGTPLAPWTAWAESALQLRASPCYRDGALRPTAECAHAIVDSSGSNSVCMASAVQTGNTPCGERTDPYSQVPSPKRFVFSPADGARIDPSASHRVAADPEPPNAEAPATLWVTSPDGVSYSVLADFPPYAVKVDARVRGTWQARLLVGGGHGQAAQHHEWSFEVRQDHGNDFSCGVSRGRARPSLTLLLALLSWHLRRRSRTRS